MRTDFKRLRSISIIAVCNELGIVLHKKGSSLRSSCKICEHDSEWCFVVNEKMQRWWCHGHCGAGGDGLALFSQVRNLSLTEAAKQMKVLFRGAY
jgi:hypothetical protein